MTPPKTPIAQQTFTSISPEKWTRIKAKMLDLGIPVKGLYGMFSRMGNTIRWTMDLSSQSLKIEILESVLGAEFTIAQIRHMVEAA